MHTDTTVVPDIARADAGPSLVGEWRTGGPDEQRDTADAAMDAWRHTAWPHGLLAHTCLLGEDERTVLHYSQWSNQNAARSFAGTGKTEWIAAVRATVPEVEHRKVTAYRLYRNTTPLDEPPRTGCLVTVTIDFEGRDAQRQQAWVDNVFAAAGTAAASPEAGMLGAHFHLSVDQTRVLNLAEWTTHQAHQDATIATDTSAQDFRAKIQPFPGITHSVVQRYTPYRYAAVSATSP